MKKNRKEELEEKGWIIDDYSKFLNLSDLEIEKIKNNLEKHRLVKRFWTKETYKIKDK